MESKRDKLISVYVSEGELKRIAECADVEKTSPNMWVRRVVTDIARRAVLHGSHENSEPDGMPHDLTPNKRHLPKIKKF
jgi:hypothetical protein